MSRRTTLGVLVILALIAGVAIAAYRSAARPDPLPADTKSPVRSVIGASVEGRAIEAFTYGNGPARLLFVGGMHGGYEWNSVVLAYEFLDYLDAHPDFVPQNTTVTVIPSLNPDGVYSIIRKEGRFTVQDVPAGVDNAPGRFNARGVDLNRNFDCKWKPVGTWRNKPVSAGAEPFSEPETRALRDFVIGNKFAGVIFWHSQANAVYASECEQGILPGTRALMNAYADASGYAANDSFSAYEVNGDAEGWLASINIPAITVELKTHETIEWEKNFAGIRALLELYATPD